MFFICSIFFSCSADHRDLHSFPTRRSSDLLARTAHVRGLAGDGGELLGGGVEDVRVLLRVAHAHVQRDLLEARDLQKIDRKSTRLNSSHSQISYAVFCLKKKKRSNSLLQCH